MKMNEADTCRKYVVPKLQAAGWENLPHSINLQRSFNDGRVVFVGGKARRGKQKRADYLLRYHADFPIAVVEAKARYKKAADGLQQAMDYAQVLGLRFAYATNGEGIVEFDFTTGAENKLADFPTPADLWERLRQTDGPFDDHAAERLFTPSYSDRARPLRYYQEIAVNRTGQAVLEGRQRALLTLCTGSGKTVVAFQICWKLWQARWNIRGDNRRPKILFLADRNFLVDDPMAKDFRPFGDARHKLTGGDAVKSRDMYFSTYQTMAEDENRSGLYREFDPAFFDLIVVDECHRGSAREDSAWREILEWFEPATQVGMTATPRRQENANTYVYFGNPLYEYSLAQGIGDGFLAPYRVHRVITDYDAAGWRPTKGQMDRFGREIQDAEYHTPDFERKVALRARTQAIAKHLASFMAETDQFAKTIVFCVDQEHALEMRSAIAEHNTDLMKERPDYVCRVTVDEGNVGSAHRETFQDVDTRTPAILTTSQLLTTGLDAPTCKNVVLARVVGSMAEFKQIIGRGTRLRPDYGKLAFNILDYTGTATRMFADPEFDGAPVREDETVIDSTGETVQTSESGDAAIDPDEIAGPDWEVSEAIRSTDEGADTDPRKFYVDDGEVEVIRHLVYELDADGQRLTCKHLTDYAGEKVRTLYPNSSELRAGWLDAERRTEIVERLEEVGLNAATLAETMGQTEADELDLICHLAYNAPLRTRRERAEKLMREQEEFFARFAPDARRVLDAVIEKYAEHGSAQLKLPEVLEVPPLSEWGNVVELSARFGGSKALRGAVTELQRLLYA
ncbi:MAG: DEAD/DEAH box helicase [Gammaproteobacteria bacterium]|nr:DEAD/DEAH box helicase [Gammaproteobacteria bacterium]